MKRIIALNTHVMFKPDACTDVLSSKPAAVTEMVGAFLDKKDQSNLMASSVGNYQVHYDALCLKIQKELLSDKSLDYTPEELASLSPKRLMDIIKAEAKLKKLHLKYSDIAFSRYPKKTRAWEYAELLDTLPFKPERVLLRISVVFRGKQPENEKVALSFIDYVYNVVPPRPVEKMVDIAKGLFPRIAARKDKNDTIIQADSVKKLFKLNHSKEALEILEVMPELHKEIGSWFKVISAGIKCAILQKDIKLARALSDKNYSFYPAYIDQDSYFETNVLDRFQYMLQDGEVDYVSSSLPVFREHLHNEDEIEDLTQDIVKKHIDNGDFDNALDWCKTLNKKRYGVNILMDGRVRINISRVDEILELLDECGKESGAFSYSRNLNKLIRCCIDQGEPDIAIDLAQKIKKSRGDFEKNASGMWEGIW